MRKILFLDVDGVLNGNNTAVKSPEGFTGVDKDMVHVLGIIVAKTGAEVVLSSDWKTEFDFNNPLHNTPDAIYLGNELSKEGILLKEKTPDIVPYMREDEIISWLMDHPETEDFCILDDTLFGFLQCEETFPHFIRTNIYGGGIMDTCCYAKEESSAFTKEVLSTILQEKDKIPFQYNELNLEMEC